MVVQRNIGMQSITINLPDDLHEVAREIAKSRKTTVRLLLRDIIAQIAREGKSEMQSGKQ